MTASSVQSKRKLYTYIFRVSPYRYMRQKPPKKIETESFHLMNQDQINNYVIPTHK